MLDTINNITTIIVNFLTVGALSYAGFKWFQLSNKRVIISGRKKAIVTMAQYKNLDKFEKKQIIKIINAYCHRILNGERIFAADEIDFISNALGLNESITSIINNDEILKLANKYMEIANDLKRRRFLGADSELVQEQITFCEKVADLLYSNGSLRSQRSNSISRRVIDLENGQVADTYLPNFRIEYMLFKNDIFDYKLSISWIKELQSINSSYQEGFDRGSRIRNFESKNLDNTSNKTARTYDALLPTLVENDMGPQIHVANDARNGEHFLQLSIAESTYSTVEALRQVENQSISIPKIITLSLLVKSMDNKVLVPIRGKAANVIGYNNMYVPSVNGNVDMPTRFFGNTDYDQFGLPDFKKAIAREALEEINLAIDPEKIRVHGIAQIYTKDDFGTWVLAMSFQSDLTAAELDQQLIANHEMTSHEWLTIDELNQIISKNENSFMPHLLITKYYLEKYIELYEV